MAKEARNLPTPSQAMPGAVMRLRVQTHKDGCTCRALAEAITARAVGVVYTYDNPLALYRGVGRGRRAKTTAYLRLGEQRLRFCPFCGSEAALVKPRYGTVLP